MNPEAIPDVESTKKYRCGCGVVLTVAIFHNSPNPAKHRCPLCERVNEYREPSGLTGS